MEWKDLKQIMEVVRPRYKGGRGIVFFGGEPLLRVDLIEKTVLEYGDSIPGGIGGVVTSAAVNMDRFFPLYKDNHMDLQISYDGLTHNQSRHRKFDFGVLQQYFELDDKRFQLRKTIGDSNIDTTFEDYKLGRELNLRHNVSFDFAVAHQKSYGEKFWDKFYKCSKDIWGFIADPIRNEERTYKPLTLMKDLRHVLRYIGNEEREKVIDSCEVGHILVVEGNGDCFPCTMLSQLGDNFKIGNIYGDIDLDSAKYMCKPLNCDCPYSVVCGGGCRWERFQEHGKEGIKTSKLNSTCYMLHIKYTTARDFFEGLSDTSKALIDAAVTRFERYQKMTFDMGMYIQVHKIAKQAVKDIESNGLISWR
jgi:radical SAM protein with 4Fe4S-binding SPASM domain